MELGRAALSTVTHSDMEMSLRTNPAKALYQAYHLNEDSSLLIEGSVVLVLAVRHPPAGTPRAARLTTAGICSAH